MQKSYNDKIRLKAQIELARRSFFEYCRLKAPDFYKPNREFLVKLCNEFQDFLDSDEEIMIINLPPRHGKSRTASCFVEWVLGRDRNAKIMTGSYNETLSAMFSKNVRNTISEVKADASKTVYSDIFPETRIKSGDAAMKLWSLEGGYNNYLATSPTGTATGFGCSLMIIDDLIKNAEEASNENVKQKHWEWFTNTMLSRREEGAKVIIIMTRWASDDLAGRAIEHYTNKETAIRHISMKALIDEKNEIMLCPEILSYSSYFSTVRAMGADIASANYQQEPIDLKGRLYEHFKVYTQLPELEGIPDLAHIATITEFSGDCILAVPLKFYKSPKHNIRGKPLFCGGRSDNFDALDEVISQWIDAIREGRVQKYIPEDLIPRNPDDGSLGRVNSFGTQFVKLNSSLGDETSSRITTIQPEIRYEAFAATYTNILLLCLQGILSPATLGIDVITTYGRFYIYFNALNQARALCLSLRGLSMSL